MSLQFSAVRPCFANIDLTPVCWSWRAPLGIPHLINSQRGPRINFLHSRLSRKHRQCSFLSLSSHLSHLQSKALWLSHHTHTYTPSHTLTGENVSLWQLQALSFYSFSLCLRHHSKNLTQTVVTGPARCRRRVYCTFELLLPSYNCWFCVCVYDVYKNH